MIFIEIVKLIWDIIKFMGPCVGRIFRSRTLRGSFAKGGLSPGTPGHDIHRLIIAMEDPHLYIGTSLFPPLLEIRRLLWKAHQQLHGLAYFARVTRGENNSETRFALRQICAIHGDEALPFLHAIVNYVDAHDDIRKLARALIATLEKNSDK
jgi:hypothetical protein